MDEASGFLTAPAAAVATSRQHTVTWKAASVVAALAFAGVSVMHFREKPPAARELTRLELLLPDKTTLQKFAISPDGRKIAFYAISAGGAGGVWVRSFDSGESRRMAETAPSPTITWSPDSRFVAFPGGEALNKLMKVEVSGGSPQTLCEIENTPERKTRSPRRTAIAGAYGITTSADERGRVAARCQLYASHRATRRS
jgi:hypothetical protein